VLGSSCALLREDPIRQSPCDVIRDHLAVSLGPHTARNAVKTFAARALRKAPEDLTLDDVPALLAALRPMLRTLIGADACDEFVVEIRQELVL
jgi:hypothetical protein